MFSFVVPFLDGKVWNVMIGASSVADAVDQYLRLYWNSYTITVGVFHNHALVGRIIGKYDNNSDENHPKFQAWV